MILPDLLPLTVQPDARDYNALLELLRTLMAGAGSDSAGSFPSGAGSGTADVGPQTIWGRITGGVENGKYDWVRVIPTGAGSAATAEWPDKVSGRIGYLPAVEVTGRLDVPDNTVVLLKQSDVGPWFDFRYDGAAGRSGSGGSGGSGGDGDGSDGRCAGTVFSRTMVTDKKCIDGKMYLFRKLETLSYNDAGCLEYSQGEEIGEETDECCTTVECPDGGSGNPSDSVVVCCCPDLPVPIDLVATISGNDGDTTFPLTYGGGGEHSTWSSGAGTICTGLGEFGMAVAFRCLDGGDTCEFEVYLNDVAMGGYPGTLVCDPFEWVSDPIDLTGFGGCGPFTITITV